MTIDLFILKEYTISICCITYLNHVAYDTGQIELVARVYFVFSFTKP